jgi:septal ring factor EnvC (AmiA/AmiB activator)
VSSLEEEIATLEVQLVDERNKIKELEEELESTKVENEENVRKLKKALECLEEERTNHSDVEETLLNEKAQSKLLQQIIETDRVEMKTKYEDEVAKLDQHRQKVSKIKMFSNSIILGEIF